MPDVGVSADRLAHWSGTLRKRDTCLGLRKFASKPRLAGWVVNYAQSDGIDPALLVIERLRHAGFVDRNAALGEAYPDSMMWWSHLRVEVYRTHF